MKRTPQGLGAFIAFRSRIGTATAAAALAVSIGCSWVAPRAGDYGAVNDAAFLAAPSDRGDRAKVKARIRDEIAAYHAAGLLVFPWLYSRPECWRSEVEAFALLIECGADGVIIDAESQWAGYLNAARQYMAALRARLGDDVFIADAPWPWIASHPEYPEREFAAGVDARLIQAYWTEINRAGAKADVEAARAQWAARFADPARTAEERDPVWPIAVTYGRAELIAEGAPPCPGDMSLADMKWFLDQYDGQPVSLYSLEMLLAPTQTARDLLAALRERAAPGAPEQAPGAESIVPDLRDALLDNEHTPEGDQ